MIHVAKGLLMGVGVGLVTAAIRLTIDYLIRLKKRRAEIAYLKKRLVEQFGIIHSLSGKMITLPDGSQLGPIELARQPVLEGMMRELSVIADNRMNALTDNQMHELRNAISSANSHISFVLQGAHALAAQQGKHLQQGTGLPPQIEFYQGVYALFLKIEWLDLPEDMPTAA